MLQVVDVVGGVGTVTALDAPFGLRLDAARWEGIGSWRRRRREAKNAALRIRGMADAVAAMRVATAACWEGIGDPRCCFVGF